ncbi:MAG: hypothetical protein HC764_14740 [Pleurocapsa sp. CRU_1_2]|nr:hypothetical protein [Pleurocapsa sp. CRU_1_2]
MLFFSNFDQLAQSSQTNYGYVPPAKDQKQQEGEKLGLVSQDATLNNL